MSERDLDELEFGPPSHELKEAKRDADIEKLFLAIDRLLEVCESLTIATREASKGHKQTTEILTSAADERLRQVRAMDIPVFGRAQRSLEQGDLDQAATPPEAA